MLGLLTLKKKLCRESKELSVTVFYEVHLLDNIHRSLKIVTVSEDLKSATNNSWNAVAKMKFEMIGYHPI